MRPGLRPPPRDRLVEICARLISRRTTGQVRWEDVYDLGIPALVEAKAEWDGRGVFEPFALQRVRWAMLDGLRKRRREPVTMALAAAELSARQNAKTVADVVRAGDDHPAIAELSIDDVVDEAAFDYALDLGALREAEEAAERQKVRRAVKALPPPQDEVMERYVYKGETFADVATALGLTPPAVFKIHAAAVQSLKQTLAGKAKASAAT